MYAQLFKQFENAQNLAGKAWQHAVNIDLIEQSNIKDCSIHCFQILKRLSFLSQIQVT